MAAPCKISRSPGCVAVLGLLVLTATARAANPPPVDPSLGAYQAQAQVSGVIRSYGFGLGGVLQQWEEGFRRIHAGVRFDDHLPTSDAAIPALITGVADLAPDGGEASLTETLA